MMRFGLIGFPIAHSKSPELFAQAYSGRYPYDLMEKDTFSEAWKAFVEGPYRAVNVTAPFKRDAAAASDNPDDAVRALGAANILLKTDEGIAAYNSDYLGVRLLLETFRRRDPSLHTVKVIGGGGAGVAARKAACDLNFETSLLHHDEMADGASADIIVYTLPREAPGCDRLDCRVLLEANYRDPVLCGHAGYVPGMAWLRAQAVTGYEIMTGERPSLELEF